MLCPDRTVDPPNLLWVVGRTRALRVDLRAQLCRHPTALNSAVTPIPTARQYAFPRSPLTVFDICPLLT